ncbi:unnamed protein product, partial [Closterium sp. Naga37s-1]
SAPFTPFLSSSAISCFLPPHRTAPLLSAPFPFPEVRDEQQEKEEGCNGSVLLGHCWVKEVRAWYSAPASPTPLSPHGFLPLPLHLLLLFLMVWPHCSHPRTVPSSPLPTSSNPSPVSPPAPYRTFYSSTGSWPEFLAPFKPGRQRLLTWQRWARGIGGPNGVGGSSGSGGEHARRAGRW